MPALAAGELINPTCNYERLISAANAADLTPALSALPKLNLRKCNEGYTRGEFHQFLYELNTASLQKVENRVTSNVTRPQNLRQQYGTEVKQERQDGAFKQNIGRVVGSLSYKNTVRTSHGAFCVSPYEQGTAYCSKEGSSTHELRFGVKAGVCSVGRGTVRTRPGNFRKQYEYLIGIGVPSSFSKQTLHLVQHKMSPMR